MSWKPEYCLKHCPKGKAKSKELLADNNSPVDAAMDFSFFVDTCKQTCTEQDKKDTNKNK